jgi:hypothetical protein
MPRHDQPPSPPDIQGSNNNIDPDEPEDSKGEEVIEEEMDINREITPTHHDIPSTVVVKTHRRARGPRKSQKETTWTQYYFDVTILEETWNHLGLKNKPLVANRLWIYKIYGPSFKSTDQERHSNTLRLVKHLKEQYNIDKQKHKLDV